MRICVAQTKPIRGDISANIGNHLKMIHLAISMSAEVIVFPELSLTGYEPTLASTLATNPEDERFDVFQKISDAGRIKVGVGLPTKNSEGICISMVIFHPGESRQVYSKEYLHPDEKAYFIAGRSSENQWIKSKIAPAICYEISVQQHSEKANKLGAEIYLASVAKSVSGVEKATKELSEIARKYSMTVLMSNCIGTCDDFECGGKSSIWNSHGTLAGQLNDINEGILIIDTETREVIEKEI